MLAPNGYGAAVLRNWLLGMLATIVWTGNYLAYFARDLRAFWRRWRQRRDFWAGFGQESRRRVAGPLVGEERRSFPPPPPPPPPVREADVVPRPDPGAHAP
jgi:hypothetical protein